MTQRFFITGTGTDIGKTFVTAALCWQLRSKDVCVQALKPVVSGYRQTDDSDVSVLLAAQGLEETREQVQQITPWRFAAPLSPDIAAAREGKMISLNALDAFCRKARDVDVLLVEGAGGVMTPLGAGLTMLDWMERLNWPVIMVGGTYLGSISHTLTGCMALRARGIGLHAMVINESCNPALSLDEHKEALIPHLPENTAILATRRLDFSRELWKNAGDLTGICI